jgi:hypothetical protein
MENWKKAVLVGSAGAAAILIAKRKRPAGFLAAGIGLVILAGEYPRAFDRIANLTPGPLGRGLRLVEFVSLAGQRLAEESRHDLEPDYEA